MVKARVHKEKTVSMGKVYGFLRIQIQPKITDKIRKVYLTVQVKKIFKLDFFFLYLGGLKVS